MLNRFKFILYSGCYLEMPLDARDRFIIELFPWLEPAFDTVPVGPSGLPVFNWIWCETAIGSWTDI